MCLKLWRHFCGGLYVICFLLDECIYRHIVWMNIYEMFTIFISKTLHDSSTPESACQCSSMKWISLRMTAVTSENIFTFSKESSVTFIHIRWTHDGYLKIFWNHPKFLSKYFQIIRLFSNDPCCGEDISKPPLTMISVTYADHLNSYISGNQSIPELHGIMWIYFHCTPKLSSTYLQTNPFVLSKETTHS